MTILRTIAVTVAILAQGTPRGDAFYAALLLMQVRSPLAQFLYVSVLARRCSLARRRTVFPGKGRGRGGAHLVHTFSAFWL